MSNNKEKSRSKQNRKNEARSANKDALPENVHKIDPGKSSEETEDEELQQFLRELKEAIEK